MKRDPISIAGTLEIDINRGVVYFHDNRGMTVLRVCNLKIRDTFNQKLDMIDARAGDPPKMEPLP